MVNMQGEERPRLVPEMFEAGLPWEALDRLRDEEPIFWMRLPDGTPVWNLVRHQDVSEALRALHVFGTPNVDASLSFGGSAPPGVPTDPWTIHAMMVLVPPAHGTYRHQFTGLMKRDLLEKIRPRFAQVARDAVHAVRAVGVFDAVEQCAAPTAAAFVCDYLGIAPEKREYFRRLSAVFMGDTLPPVTTGGLRASGFAPASGIQSSPGRAAMDLVAESWGHAPWLDPGFVERAGRWEVEDLGLQLLSAGVAGLRNCLVYAILLLAPRWDEVQRDPEVWLQRLPIVVNEIIRCTTPLLRARRVLTQDVTLHGTTMSAGDTVLLWLVGANFDPRVFSDPRAFDPFRSPNPHVSFGGGPHHCLGAPLARLEVEEFVRAMILGWRTIDAGTPVRYASDVVNEISALPLVVT